MRSSRSVQVIRSSCFRQADPAVAADLLVIGAVSDDRLHIGGQVHDVPGGAGLYTALGARAISPDVTLWAPKPNPLPTKFKGLEPLRWIGPRIAPHDIPALEIEHHGGGRATLLRAGWGAIEHLAPDQLPDLGRYDIVHVAALGPTQKQLAFVQAIRRKSQALVSAGTYARETFGQTDGVRELISACDAFFLNANEAQALWGEAIPQVAQPGKRLFITEGDRGARVLTEQGQKYVPAVSVTEVDPTGAGDAFCGAVLAGLAAGQTAAQAGLAAVEIAGRNVSAVGPKNLLPD